MSIDNLRLLATVFNSAAKSIPLVGGPLQTALGITLTILDIADRVQVAKELCKDLAEKCSRLVVALLEEALDDGEATTEAIMLIRVNRLIELLRKVGQDMGNLIPRKISWIRRFWRLRYIEDELKRHAAQIDEAFQIFQTGTLIDLHKLQVKTNQLIARISSPPQEETEVEEIRRADVQFFEQLTVSASSTEAVVHRGTLRRSGDSVPVFIKRYTKNGHRKLKEDIRQLGQLLHSNLPMVIGKSYESEPVPYLLVSNYADRGARLFLSKRISDTAVNGFMSSLFMMRDVLSALHFLINTINIAESDLETCTDFSRFCVTGDGKVLLGHDLITEGLAVTARADGKPLKWLEARCWYIMEGLLYGDTDSINWNEWDSVCTDTPHVRPLLTMVNFMCPSFDVMTERFVNLATQLKPEYEDGKLTYPRIREELLKIPGMHPTYLYKPIIPLEMTVGDLGYIRGTSFIKLDSIKPIICGVHKMEDYTAVSGEITSTPLADGVIHHNVEKALYVQFSRWRDSEFVDDPHQYWGVFVEKARELVQNNGGNHDFKGTDLILVTGLGTDYREGIYRFNVQDGVTPPDLSFLEFTNPNDVHAVEWQPSEVWQDSWRITTSEERTPQYIGFLQLEDGEC